MLIIFLTDYILLLFIILCFSFFHVTEHTTNNAVHDLLNKQSSPTFKKKSKIKQEIKIYLIHLQESITGKNELGNEVTTGPIFYTIY